MSHEPRPPIQPGEPAPPFARRAVNREGTVSLADLRGRPERAGRYFKYRPARVLVGADPEATTHRAFRVPEVEVVEDPATSKWPLRITLAEMVQVRVNPTGEQAAERIAGVVTFPGDAEILEAARALGG